MQDELISRQAVLNEAFEVDTKEWGRIEVVGVDAIDALPSVKPQERTGHWITLKDEYGNVHEAVCSKCDFNGNHKWAFCPNCGANMSENPTISEPQETKPEISSYYGLRSYVRERSDKE
jgi:hypothetical protein